MPLQFQASSYIFYSVSSLWLRLNAYLYFIITTRKSFKIKKVKFQIVELLIVVVVIIDVVFFFGIHFYWKLLNFEMVDLKK